MCGPLPFDPPSSSRNQRQFRPTSRFHTSLGKSHTLNSQLKPAENLEAWQCLPRNDPWLCHVNAWQKPLQYCKVISLQLIKINEKKKEKKKMIRTLVRRKCAPSAVSGSGLPAREEAGHSHTTRGRYWFRWQYFGKKHFPTSATSKKSFAPRLLTQIYKCMTSHNTQQKVLWFILSALQTTRQSLNLPENSQLPGRNFSVFATALYRY